MARQDRDRGVHPGRGSRFNGQISYGEDVISRIMYARKPDGLERLKTAVVPRSTYRGRADEDERHRRRQISHMVLAGNTTMTHLAWARSQIPHAQSLHPYIELLPPVRARELGSTWRTTFLRSFSFSRVIRGSDIVAVCSAAACFSGMRLPFSWT